MSNVRCTGVFVSSSAVDCLERLCNVYNYMLSGTLNCTESFPAMYTGDECNARTSQQTDASSGGLQRRRPFPAVVIHVRLWLFACSGRSHAI